MMPIGVPRVPYRTPREGGWQWVDIWNCLYRERIIFLSKAVDDELGNQLVATMLYLDSENKKDMSLYINCSGGDVSGPGAGAAEGWLAVALVVARRPGRRLHYERHTGCAHRPPCCLPSPSAALQVVPCLAIHDTMRHVKSDVATVGFGGCMGMSGFLLAVGKKVRPAAGRGVGAAAKGPGFCRGERELPAP